MTKNLSFLLKMRGGVKNANTYLNGLLNTGDREKEIKKRKGVMNTT
jgi:hypothetical protein